MSSICVAIVIATAVINDNNNTTINKAQFTWLVTTRAPGGVRHKYVYVRKIQ